MARKSDRDKERGRAIAEQRRSNAAGYHKSNRKNTRHYQLCMNDETFENVCACGNDWPCNG